MNVQTLLDLFPQPKNPVAFKAYGVFIEEKLLDQSFGQEDFIENHHILPVSLGADKSFKSQKWNKIKLRARDHFLAHKLLWEAYGGLLANAYFQMSVTRGFTIEAEEYEKLRKEYALRKSQQMKDKKRGPFSEEHKRHISQAAKLRERRPHSEETKEKMRKAWEARKLKEPSMTQAQREKISKAHKGKKISDETKRKIGESLKGSNHWTFGKLKEEMPMSGKKHSADTKAKMSKSQMGISKPAHLIACPICGKMCQSGGSLKSHLSKCKK